MCFNNDDDNEFFRDDDSPTSDDIKAFFDNYDRAADFRPDETILLFGCELTPSDLQLAAALLSRFKRVKSACNVLRAADALRDVIGIGRTTADESTKRWNNMFQVGQQVQFWPDGRNGETYLSRTTSPAFDTHKGPCILVEDHETAVALCNVEPRRIKTPEVKA
jgi:hypothetical protein